MFRRSLAVAFVLGFLTAMPAHGQRFQLGEAAVVGGGGRSEGGSHGLFGVVKPAGSGKAAGARFEVKGPRGIAIPLQVAGAPRLAARAKAGQLILEWTDGSFTLERSPAVSGPDAVWTPVPAVAGQSEKAVAVSLPATAGAWFYRLQKREGLSR